MRGLRGLRIDAAHRDDASVQTCSRVLVMSLSLSLSLGGAQLSQMDSSTNDMSSIIALIARQVLWTTWAVFCWMMRSLVWWILSCAFWWVVRQVLESCFDIHITEQAWFISMVAYLSQFAHWWFWLWKPLFRRVVSPLQVLIVKSLMGLVLTIVTVSVLIGIVYHVYRARSRPRLQCNLVKLYCISTLMSTTIVLAAHTAYRSMGMLVQKSNALVVNMCL